MRISRAIFKSKLIHNLNRGKSGPEMWATFLIFKNLPKVNNLTTGEDSPNLVTLVV
jgi:hypothetical protein